MTNRYLISRVLNVPKVEPISWEKWWDFWNTNAKPLKKSVSNHNAGSAQWIGFDCYRHSSYNPATLTTHYKAEFFDCSELLPMLSDVISQLPIFVSNARIIQSRSMFPPHRDYTQDNISVRTMLYDSNPKSTFYYISSKSKDYQQLPDSSNTWMYYDHVALHGTDYNPAYQKIMIAYYGGSLYADKLLEIESIHPSYDIYSIV